MKIKSLREHYHSIGNVTYIPKRAFTTKEEIKKELGFDPEECYIYTCDFCNKLHLTSHKLAKENNVN